MTTGADPKPAPRRGEPRAPLRVRKASKRRAAQRRIVARTTRPLTAAQRAFDPLARWRSTNVKRAGIAALAIIGSIGVHLAVIGGAIWSRGEKARVTHDEVKVAIREKPPEPEKTPPPPPAPVERPRVTRVAKTPPPPAPPPVAPPKAKPVRVVGLSLESTMGEGGDGPSFAAGNTRMGEVAEKAVAPKDISGVPTGDTKAPESGKGNQAASRIPVAGVKYVAPKKKNPDRKPPFPPTLRNQGIEGDVVVMVNIDATGKVRAVKIIKGTPYPEFDEEARKFALTEEFEPALRDGVPIPYSLSYTYRFRLEDE